MPINGAQKRERILSLDAALPKLHRGFAGKPREEHRRIAPFEVHGVSQPIDPRDGKCRSASPAAVGRALNLPGLSRLLVLAWILFLSFLQSAAAQKAPSAQPTPMRPADDASQVLAPEWRAAFPLRSAFGSLCSLGPLACALIDRPFALNAHLELIIRPKAADGSTGVLLPFGVSVPLFGRAEVGLGSCYGGWWASKDAADKAHPDLARSRPAGLCPLWLAAKLLLFPWFRDPHQNPALAIEYQFEYQAGPFSGLNQLGLPGHLSKLSLAYRHPLGRLELGAAGTVLFDHTTHAGLLQFGPHLGYRLPVGEHFWLFGQAMV